MRHQIQTETVKQDFSYPILVLIGALVTVGLGICFFRTYPDHHALLLTCLVGLPVGLVFVAFADPLWPDGREMFIGIAVFLFLIFLGCKIAGCI